MSEAAIPGASTFWLITFQSGLLRGDSGRQNWDGDGKNERWCLVQVEDEAKCWDSWVLFWMLSRLLHSELLDPISCEERELQVDC